MKQNLNIFLSALPFRRVSDFLEALDDCATRLIRFVDASNFFGGVFVLRFTARLFLWTPHCIDTETLHKNFFT
jgi:hypothetical protein